MAFQTNIFVSASRLVLFTNLSCIVMSRCISRMYSGYIRGTQKAFLFIRILEMQAITLTKKKMSKKLRFSSYIRKIFGIVHPHLSRLFVNDIASILESGKQIWLIFRRIRLRCQTDSWSDILWRNTKYLDMFKICFIL